MKYLFIILISFLISGCVMNNTSLQRIALLEAQMHQAQTEIDTQEQLSVIIISKINDFSIWQKDTKEDISNMNKRLNKAEKQHFL